MSRTDTVTLLFTDIEGSTRMLAHLGDGYADVLAASMQILRSATEERDGWECGTQGDAFYAAFHRAHDGFGAAVEAQRRLAAYPWPDGVAVRVRMGLHTGDVLTTDSGYVGMEVHRAARICSAAYGGQILVSDAVRALVGGDLPPGVSLRDVGSHRLKDLVRPQRLFQVEADGLRADFPALRTLDSVPNNLPRAITSFVGRERETAEITTSLEAARLVTLTGAGGVGKSRLAVHAATALLDKFGDGVWLVELAALTDPALVPKAVASVLNVPEYPGRALPETLAGHLRNASVLLVLDNCEHVVGACAELAGTLLGRCPNLRILAASQEGLAIAGEVARPVAPLSMPDTTGPAAPEDLLRSEAVRLFVERAAAGNPGFALTPANAQAVAGICVRLDGMPLALELAAARAKALTAQQIAARLDDRFRLLEGGSQAAPPRHRTLRGVMEWSYDLLSARERKLLRRLSVFAGGFRLEAAEAVCSASPLPKRGILTLLTRLVDRSLVNADARRPEVRYRMLETVRQYAREQLTAAEAADLRRRHRAWYAQFAEQASEGTRGPEQLAWLARLEAEHDNLRAALAWKSSRAAEIEQRLNLLGAMHRLWDCHTHWSEERRWVETVMAETRPARSTAWARAHSMEGFMAFRRGDYDGARIIFEECLALSKALGNPRQIQAHLQGCGYVAAFDGRFDAAVPLLEEALKNAEAQGDKFAIGSALAQLGQTFRMKGDAEAAVRFSERSVDMFRAAGTTREIAWALRLTGHALRAVGQRERAAEMYRESLALFADITDKWVAGECLEGLAAIALADGDRDRAARLFGTVEAARERYGITMARPDRARQAATAAAARDELSGGGTAAAWAAGAAIPLELAIEETLSARP